MNLLKSLKILLIGDTRIKTLVREKDEKQYDIKIFPIEGGQYCHVIKEINEQLRKDYYSLLIIMTLHNDLTIFKNLSSNWGQFVPSKLFMRINSEFNVNKFISSIVDQNKIWENEYPDLHIVWVIPAVPDFVRYNERYMGIRAMRTDFISVLAKEQKMYAQHTKEIAEKLKEYEISYIDLNRITRFRGKRLIKKQKKYLQSTWIDPVLTSDGLNPQTRMAERFFRMLSQLMKYLAKRRKNILKAELIKRSQITSNSYLEYQMGLTSSLPLTNPQSSGYSVPETTFEEPAITRLREEHMLEWEHYQANPKLHPDYNGSFHVWVREMTAQGISYLKVCEMEKEWWNYWLRKLKYLYHISWLEKLKSLNYDKRIDHLALGKSISSPLSSISSDSEGIENTNSELKMRKKKSPLHKSLNIEDQIQQQVDKKSDRLYRTPSLSSISADSFDSDSDFDDEKRQKETMSAVKKRLKKNLKSTSGLAVGKRDKDYSDPILASYIFFDYNSDSEVKEDLEENLVSTDKGNTDSKKEASNGRNRIFNSSSLTPARIHSTDSVSVKSEEEYSKSKNDLNLKTSTKRKITDVLTSQCSNELTAENFESELVTKKLAKFMKKNSVARQNKPFLSIKGEKFLDLTWNLCQISDQFGNLGTCLSVLHVKAREYLNNRLDPLNCLDEDANMLLELISDEIKEILKNSGPTRKEKLALENAERKLIPFLTILDGKDTDIELGVGPYYGLEISSLIKATFGMHKADIIRFIKTFLTYKGYQNVSEEDLDRIYLEIKHHEIDLT